MGQDTNSEHDADIGWLDDRANGFIIVHLKFVTKTSDDPSSFVVSQCFIRIKVMMKDLLPLDDIGPYKFR